LAFPPNDPLELAVKIKDSDLARQASVDDKIVFTRNSGACRCVHETFAFLVTQTDHPRDFEGTSGTDWVWRNHNCVGSLSMEVQRQDAEKD
jgi:hypothetical protein